MLACTMPCVFFYPRQHASHYIQCNFIQLSWMAIRQERLIETIKTRVQNNNSLRINYTWVHLESTLPGTTARTAVDTTQHQKCMMHTSLENSSMTINVEFQRILQQSHTDRRKTTKHLF